MRTIHLTCDRCGSTTDVAWYRVTSTSESPGCAQPTFNVDLCGYCYHSVRIAATPEPEKSATDG